MGNRNQHAAIELVRSLVMAQGSIFIRELLRRKRRDNAAVRIGVTKEEIEANLLEAIRSGALTLDETRDWLDEVEGWGHQHVYLHDIKPPRGGVWATADRIREQAARAGYATAWEAPPQPEFPDELTLSGIAVTGGRITARWHQRSIEWRRAQDYDKQPENIDGDRYEFRAYRRVLGRAAMRLVIDPVRERAALFLQLPIGDSHTAALAAGWKTAAQLAPGIATGPARIADAVKALDQEELDTGAQPLGSFSIRSQNTRFSAGGASVAFTADREEDAWKSIAAVRRVRNALIAKDFQGDSAKFVVTLRSGTGRNRDVVMSLTAQDRRIYFWSQMTSEEVWLVLDHIIASLG